MDCMRIGLAITYSDDVNKAADEVADLERAGLDIISWRRRNSSMR